MSSRARTSISIPIPNPHANGRLRTKRQPGCKRVPLRTVAESGILDYPSQARDDVGEAREGEGRGGEGRDGDGGGQRTALRLGWDEMRWDEILRIGQGKGGVPVLDRRRCCGSDDLLIVPCTLAVVKLLAV